MYVKQRGNATRKNGDKIFLYYCNRSGVYEPKGKGLRRLKSQGSTKIGTICPARMMVKVTSEKVIVHFFQKHENHKMDMEHLRLPQSEREAIADQMPSTCCVPGCKSNYKTKENVRVFKFPADAETKDKWLKEIQRKDFVPGSRSAVCIFHFKDEDIVREDVFTQPDGTKKVYPREKYKLRKNAVPCIFPYIPSSDIPALRKLSGKGRKRKLKKSNENITEILDVDKISNFRDLVGRTDIVKESWCTYVEDLRITYYKLEPNSSPLHIRYSFTIDTNLRISIFCREKKIDCKDMVWLFSMDEEKQLVLERYSQLENVFVYLDYQKNAHFLLF